MSEEFWSARTLPHYSICGNEKCKRPSMEGTSVAFFGAFKGQAEASSTLRGSVLRARQCGVKGKAMGLTERGDVIMLQGKR